MTPAAEVLVAACLAGVAVLLPASGRILAQRRLSAISPAPGASPGAASFPPRGRTPSLRLVRGIAAGLAGAAVAVVLGGIVGLAAGPVVAVVAARSLARLEPAATARARARVLTDLPVAAELLAAGTCAGAALDDVTRAVADAVGGPLGAELTRVVALVRLGADPAEAWSGLGGAAGGPGLGASPTLAAFGRAVGRAVGGGAPLVPSLLRVADEQRAAARLRAEVAARRVGVLAVAPLTLCFLPAFVLVGVVPVVVSVAGPVLDAFAAP